MEDQIYFDNYPIETSEYTKTNESSEMKNIKEYFKKYYD